MALKFVAFFFSLVLLIGFYYVTVIRETESVFSFGDGSYAKTTTPPKFDISELISEQPSVSSKYPGGFFKSPDAECSDGEVELLILVLSAPNNFERRQAIRETWALDLNNSTRLFFILGGVGLIESQLVKLDAEEDVILANFTDTYRSLTLKTVALLDWANQNCNGTFLLKCDDDMYINYPKLRRKLFEENAVFKPKTIIGRVAKGWPPIRDPKSKYFLSVKEFAPKVLPVFTSGPAYLMTGDLIHPLLEATLKELWLSLEDVLVTGIVANHRLGAKLENWPTFHNERTALTSCNAQQFISIHDVKPNEQRLLRRARSNNATKFCKIVP